MIKKIKMSVQKNEWPSQILQALYSQHPYIILDDAKIVINDLQKSDSNTEMYTGIIYAIAGQNMLEIPFVISDGYLFPMDIIYDQASEKIMWLTKPNFYKIIFNEASLGTVTKQEPSGPEVSYTDTSNMQLARSYPELLDRTGLVYGDAVGKVVVAHIVPQGRLRNIDVYENMKKKASYKVPRAEAYKVLSLYGLNADKETITNGGFIANTIKTAQLAWVEPVLKEYTMTYLNGLSRNIKQEKENYVLFNKTASIGMLEPIVDVETIKSGDKIYLRHGNKITEPLKVEKTASDISGSVHGYGLLSNVPFIMRFVKTAQDGFMVTETSNGTALLIVGQNVEILPYGRQKTASERNEEQYYKDKALNTIIRESPQHREALNYTEFAVKLATYGLSKDEIYQIISKLNDDNRKLAIIEPEHEKIASLNVLTKKIESQIKKIANLINKETKLADALPDASTVIDKLEKQINVQKDYKDIDAITENLNNLIEQLIGVYWNLLTTEDKRIPIETVRDAIGELESLRDSFEQFAYVQKFEPPESVQS